MVNKGVQKESRKNVVDIACLVRSWSVHIDMVNDRLIVSGDSRESMKPDRLYLHCVSRVISIVIQHVSLALRIRIILHWHYAPFL